MKNTEIQLLNQQEVRNSLISNIEILEKVKLLVLLPYGESMTTEMVAEYYEVGKEAISSLVKRNREELESNGMATLEGEKLINFKNNFDRSSLNLSKLNKANRSLMLFTRRTILNIGMLLKDSEVAKRIRVSLLDISEKKETIIKIVDEIDTEQSLMLAIMMAKDDLSQMAAINNLKRYRDIKEAKITEERDVAVGKVQNLTKSDATWGLREARVNIGVKEKKFIIWLIKNKYMFRQHKSIDGSGKPTGRLKSTAKYTHEPTRYFTDINQVDRVGETRTQTVFTLAGVEFFRGKIELINE